MNDFTHSRVEVNRPYDSFGMVILPPTQICNFHFSLFNLHLPVLPLERLRETKLNLSLMQFIDRRRRRTSIQILRNQKLRRIQKESVINRQRASQRSLDAKAEADRVTPTHAEILSVQVFHEISRGRDWSRMKYVADAAEHVAAVVKRNRLEIRRHRHPRFQIHHHHRVAANRHREWV